MQPLYQNEKFLIINGLPTNAGSKRAVWNNMNNWSAVNNVKGSGHCQI